MTQDAPIGPPVPGWTPPPPPGPGNEPGSGRHARLEPLLPVAHAEALHGAFAGDDGLWTYMPYGPFASADVYRDWARDTVASPSHRFYAIHDLDADRLGGVASYLRIDPAAGSIEVGNICFSPALQRTRAATEAMWLMMRWAFEAGYRRYEWKCNALNAPSRRAAERLGFSYEGVFRQATVVKGRNRDTAWFACVDGEWPALDAAFRAWLDPGNFDAEGRQRQSLSALTRPILVARDPTAPVA